MATNIYKGSVEFSFTNIDWLLSEVMDTTVLLYNEYDSLLRVRLTQDSAFAYDSTLAHYSLSISHLNNVVGGRKPLNAEIPKTKIIIDSLVITDIKNNVVVPIIYYEQFATKNMRHRSSTVRVEPIVVPMMYKWASLYFDFVVMIYDDSSSVLLEQIPVHLRITCRKTYNVYP